MKKENTPRHTLGPWRKSEQRQGLFPSQKIQEIWSGPHTQIAKLTGDDAEMNANADLIATAPELLGILKLLVEYNRAGGIVPSIWDAARRTVEKAEGLKK